MRLIARFAKDKDTHFEVITMFDSKTDTVTVSKENPILATLSRQHPSAIWFERKIHDDFGITFSDAFDLRPLVHQETFPLGLHPMRKDFQETHLDLAPFKPYDYEVIGGDGVFQVSVGPIHAGIIEPGHFHFSQAGEDMLHQEVRHFYKYRAIEKMLEGKTLEEAKPIIERISGNESIAYQIAWRDIILAASGVELPEALQCEHALLLELERLIHHLTDLGFIPNDAGFGAALAWASRLSEDARRQMKAITGHRFGFGAIGFETLNFQTEKLSLWLDTLHKEIAEFEEWIRDIPSLWDRFDTTGILRQEKAQKYDTVGVVARASGLPLDRRQTPFYEAHGFTLCTQKYGDVAARFKVRLAEVKNAIMMGQSFLQKLGNASCLCTSQRDGEYHSFVESSIGELFMSIEIQEGKIAHFFVRDPSFVNWQALHLMMPNNIIADFPLINKSCDLSYAGNDL